MIYQKFSLCVGVSNFFTRDLISVALFSSNIEKECSILCDNVIVRRQTRSKMGGGKREKNSKKQQRYTNRPSETEDIPQQILDLIFDSFNYGFNIELSEKSKSFVKSNYEAFFVNYFLDFFICNFVISLAVVSFWRGVWDHSLIFLEERLLNV